MPQSPLPKEYQQFLGVSASKKSLVSSPSIGTMVAGYTKTLPAIPHETRRDKMQEIHDIRHNISHEPLKRAI